MILRISAESRMTAVTGILPPQLGQSIGSTSYTFAISLAHALLLQSVLTC